jgi:hypothetical protein
MNAYLDIMNEVLTEEKKVVKGFVSDTSEEISNVLDKFTSKPVKIISLQNAKTGMTILLKKVKIRYESRTYILTSGNTYMSLSEASIKQADVTKDGTYLSASLNMIDGTVIRIEK